MPYIKPMLGDIELPLVQKLDVDGNQALAEHAVPTLEGDLLQGLGRMASRISLRGILTGSGAGRGLEDLREKFQAAQPVDFVADLATATGVVQVLIEEMAVRELAGKPERFEYAFTLREYIASTPATAEEPQEPTAAQPAAPEPDLAEPAVSDPPDVRIDEGLGTLIVEVIVEGQQDYDYSSVAVTVEGRREDASSLSRTLNNRSENIWTEKDFPAGEYLLTASAHSQSMSGSKETAVRSGETAQETITLHPAPSNIAKTFVVHFAMDNSFLEPGLCQVLQRVAEYAESNPREKLIILGHTDLVGSDEYNQKLSERRARSVYAFLTFGRDDNARREAVDEWDNLRRLAAQWQRDVQDNWGTREYQFMLQDLDYYRGNIDGNHGPKTKAAVSDFQKYHELPPTGVMDDPTWRWLIEEYLFLYSLAISENRFFRNAGDECDNGPLKWLGAGEQDPVKSTQDAWRPNRRTELLFVQGDRIPCEVPKPRTFDKPAPGGPWCLGRPYDDDNTPEAGIKRQDFLSRDGEEPNKWLVEPAEPGRTIVRGRIIKDTNDGPPFAHAKYVLIAPDGEYLHTDAGGRPDLGERPQGERRGEPIANQADENGNYGYPEETPEGTYILEIRDIDDPRLVRWKDDEEYEARGNVIFQPMNQSTAKEQQTTQANLSAGAEEGSKPSKSKDTVVQSGHVASPPIKPIISVSGSPVVLVRKSYTNPARREITLKTEPSFRGRGVFSVRGPKDAVLFFDRKVNGNQIVIPASGKDYSGKQLEGEGVKLFVEGINPSASLDDIVLTLSIKPGPYEYEQACEKTLTSVVITLDIYESHADRPAEDIRASLLQPQAPLFGEESEDKWYVGKTLSVQDLDYKQERALLIVRGVEPESFAGTMVLRQVRIKDNKGTGPANNTEVFENQLHNSEERGILSANDQSCTLQTSPKDREFWVEGKNPSKDRRDTGLQLGLNDLDDGDCVALSLIPVPIIQLESDIVIAKKPHTNPARIRATLKTSCESNRTGTFEVSGRWDAVNVFDEDGNLIRLPKEYAPDELWGDGSDLFIEGISASDTSGDVELTLTLSPDPPLPDATPAIETITAVELTLDICGSRKSKGSAPIALLSPNKWSEGRFVHVQDPDKHHGRALLRVHKPQPDDVQGDMRLVLRRVDLSRGTLRPDTSRSLKLFENEIPSSGERAKLDAETELEISQDEFQRSSILDYWIEGAIVSKELRDTGFQLGIRRNDSFGNSVEEYDGDRISMTVVRFSRLTAEIPSTQPLARHNAAQGYTAIPPSKYERGTDISVISADFDDNFRTGSYLALVNGSLPQSTPIKLEVNIAPDKVPVSWSIQRERRPAHRDDPKIITLSVNPVPSLMIDSSNHLQATLATDAVGSFHIFPFVDCNENDKFEYNDESGERIDREPFIIMNLVLIRVGGSVVSKEGATNSSNSSVVQPKNIRIYPKNPTNRAIVNFYSGKITRSDPGPAAIHCKGIIVVVGGGIDGRRGLEQLFAGWINNMIDSRTSTFYYKTDTDFKIQRMVYASNRELKSDKINVFVDAVPLNRDDKIEYLPKEPTPVIFPILDTATFGKSVDDEGTGGNRAVGLEGTENPGPPIFKDYPVKQNNPQMGILKTDLPLGQTWEVHMWDAPALGCSPEHYVYQDYKLGHFTYLTRFRSDLCFWTNMDPVPPSAEPRPRPIMGSPPPAPIASCCLYSSVQTNKWVIEFQIKFDPKTGNGTVTKPGTITLETDREPNRLARPIGDDLEVYRPIVARLYSWDARP